MSRLTRSAESSTRTLLSLALLFAMSPLLLAGECLAVTLISRSAGLQVPDKEEGNTELEFADVNGDGRLDIISVGDHGSPYVNSGEHGIMVWLGDGEGSWTVHQYGNFGYGGCALGDLNLDGLMDIAWGVHHAWGSGMEARLISAAIGNGTGLSWTDWGVGLASNGEDWGMFATALADFDGDGLLDIVSQSFGGSNGIRVYRNHGDGSWSQAYALTGGSVGYTIETADIDADGYLDIISTRSGTNVLLGDGTFGFVVAGSGLPGTSIHGIAVGDINGDGLGDISFGYSSAGVRCYTYDPGGQWIDASAGLPTSGYYDLTQLGDVDGDGVLDLVAYDPPRGYVFLGNGAGTWTADATWQMPSPGDASALRIDGDSDHDGREDIAVLATMSGFPFYRNQLRVYSPWEAPDALAARVVFPQGGETVRVGSVRFIRWLTAVPADDGPASIDLELSLTGATGPWFPIASDLPDNGRFQWAVDSPGPSADARVRVTATTVRGSVSAISPNGFTIAGDFSGVAEGRAAATNLWVEVFPNPARDWLEIRAHRPEGQPARVGIYDLSGRRIDSVQLGPGERTKGLALRETSGAALPGGLYFLRVRSGGEMRTVRVIKLPSVR
jgi:hypothetical protein